MCFSVIAPRRACNYRTSGVREMHFTRRRRRHSPLSHVCRWMTTCKGKWTERERCLQLISMRRVPFKNMSLDPYFLAGLSSVGAPWVWASSHSGIASQRGVGLPVSQLWSSGPACCSEVCPHCLPLDCLSTPAAGQEKSFFFIQVFHGLSIYAAKSDCKFRTTNVHCLEVR